MIFKILNEKLDAYFNEEEIEPSQEQQEEQEEVLADAEPEVVELVQDVTDEYGDLTIPQFIDALIKQQSTNESLNEAKMDKQDQEWISNVNGFVKQMAKQKFSTIEILHTNKDGDTYPVDCQIKLSLTPVESVHSYGSTRSYLGKLHLTNVSSAVNIPAAYMYIHQLERKHDALATDCAIVDFRKPSSDDYGTYNVIEYALRDQFMKCLIKQEGFTDSPFKYENVGPSLRGTVCFEMDSLDYPEEIRYFANLLAQGLQNALEELKSQIDKANQDKINNFNSGKSELADLSAAKRQARANAKAAKTTVKRALSKTSVINQIKALENPTEEQLAKILAAIQ